MSDEKNSVVVAAAGLEKLSALELTPPGCVSV